jgi:hypothetical protein
MRDWVLTVEAGFPACLPNPDGRLESLLPPKFVCGVTACPECGMVRADAYSKAYYVV